MSPLCCTFFYFVADSNLLMFLSPCTSLVPEQTVKVDYRASPFTFSMAPTLDGHGRMMVIATVPEASRSPEEHMSVMRILDLAKSANNCKDVLGRK